MRIPLMETASSTPHMRPLFVPRSQLYYWTREWQDGEAEALREIAEGKCRTFKDGSAAAAWLLGEVKEEPS